jgi:SAM-dependent methyltransferase
MHFPAKLTVTCALVAALIGGVIVASAEEQKQKQRKPDVEYVPTPMYMVSRMLNMARVNKDDFVIDLGSGDGRIAIAAAKRGARALGIDIDPVRIKEAKANAEKAGVTDRVEFRQQDIFETDFSQATVLTLYLLPELNRKLRPKILDMKPGTRVVSHEFDNDPWRPDRHLEYRDYEIYFWIVPAKVEGSWQVKSGDQEFTVAIKQTFQRIRGTAQIDGRTVPLRNARLRGDRIEFTIAFGRKRVSFRGTVDGGKISGKNVAGQEWTATRS